MSKHRKKSGVPDRWLDYTAVGKRLRGTRFIAFKVPLKESLSCQLPSADVFGPWELLDALDKENEELGLIIDLTFTTRYYKLQDVPRSLLCVKIFTAGHEVPSDDTILSFKRAVRKFLRENPDNDKLIGVHCTHGLNRTGYLICRYLIDVDGMDPEEAVELFNSSRGHAIERQNYLDDLQRGPKRSNEGMEEVEQEPMRGQAVHRPLFTSSDDDCKQQRAPNVSEPRYHRSFPLRGMKPHLPEGAFLPPPHLLPPPPFHPPRFHPYRWTPPQPDSRWWRPELRPAVPRQDVRWRVPPQILPPYSPRWTSDSWEGPEEKWAGPKMRQDGSYWQRHRANGHDH